jgi:hypothetical protein
MILPCSVCLCVPAIVEREEMAVTVQCKYICDMTPESRNSAVREAPQRGPLLGNGLVIKSSNSFIFNFLSRKNTISRHSVRSTG